MLFHDTLVGRLIGDQERMRQAYEQQLAAERRNAEREAASQSSARKAIEARLGELLARQARLETRTEKVARLLKDTSGEAAPQAWAKASPTRPESTPGRQAEQVPTLSSDPQLAITKLTGQKPRPVEDSVNLSSYAEEPAVRPRPPATQPPAAGAVLRDGAEGAELRPNARADDLPAAASVAAAHLPQSVDTLTNALDRVEHLQVEALRQANARAATTLDRIRVALRRSGLDPSRFAKLSAKGRGVGGPFVPLPSGTSASDFDAQSRLLEARLEEHDALSRTLSAVPIRQPFPGEIQVNSPFGPRRDPFGMGWALHPGVDLHAAEGTIVRATAAGKVTRAGYAGGYGNMVEIDHGEGLSTRYGHLSAILVSDGEVVAAGTPIGRVGSTGRSTGPHLHYETRIDGVPVDPMRFLDASPVLLAAIRGAS
jgi:murein DD-endopeptidase MepM/ murein hydrolase activator NlpD